MKNSYLTTRLILNELSLNDEQFIMELVNMPEWIKFIGDRNIRTQEDARVYIRKIIDNPTANYWVVKLQEQNTSIGIVTFMKRDYLEHYDIGFAFLSKFTNKGYAYEATTALLNDAINNPTHKQILATTVKENTNSIKLLEKLGLRFEKEIENGNNLLLVYSVTIDKLFLNQITNDFFSLFTNAKQKKPVLEKIHNICLPEIIIIKKNNDKEEIFNIGTFIGPRKKIL
jgi:RimJ/RimL family protein N-acetyltransferase